MNYKIQKEIVDNMFKDNLRNIFLESWKPYESEKEKLEEYVMNFFKEKTNNLEIESVKYIQQENSFEVITNNKITGLKKTGYNVKFESDNLRII